MPPTLGRSFVRSGISARCSRVLKANTARLRRCFFFIIIVIIVMSFGRMPPTTKEHRKKRKKGRRKGSCKASTGSGAILFLFTDSWSRKFYFSRPFLVLNGVSMCKPERRRSCPRYEGANCSGELFRRLLTSCVVTVPRDV